MALKRSMALLLCSSIALSACAPAYASSEAQYQTPVSGSPQVSNTSSAPLSATQLQQLVAPIALYPDSLLAQVLAASTYPAQVVEAERWITEHPGLKGTALADQVNTQSWDPSVKALTAFPSVLANMNKNLSWTSSLGEAYVNNAQRVMDAVQQMRHRAEQAGHLSSTPQQTVTTQGENIVIQPANPQVVYVPEYDPWLVYGPPLAVWPGWYPYPGLYLGGPGLLFGFGIGLAAFGAFGWGWHHWGFDWAHRSMWFNHRTFVSRRTSVINHRTVVNRRFGGGFHHVAGGFHHIGGGFHGAHVGGFSHTAGARHFGGASHFAGASHFGASHFAGASHFGGFSHFAGAGHFGGFHGGAMRVAGGFHGGGFHGGFHGGGHR
ncbi:MAG TPA: DUF3300 domain-containing protein [Acetobacteraceae bacterium]|nr:DUF3300 domain-containing protein [Acetobacteraceae bacterium]